MVGPHENSMLCLQENGVLTMRQPTECVLNMQSCQTRDRKTCCNGHVWQTKGQDFCYLIFVGENGPKQHVLLKL